MLAIFQKAFAHPPEELHSPASKDQTSKCPDQILHDFLSLYPQNSVCTKFGDRAVLAYVRSQEQPGFRRVFCGVDEVYCQFKGNLDNLSSLIRQYGLCKATNEGQLIIEAYKTLRDRGPYPADQVIKDFHGRFGFVIYDSRSGAVFTALSEDGGMEMYWGIAADGSVVLSDEMQLLKAGCGKSFAPFPPGCMFHSGSGVQSFEHPMHKVTAIPRVDSEGVMCGANFKVDAYTRVNTMPRVGSAANWSAWAAQSQ
ncbi:hypothetical protein AMTRI_Chr07g82110 [Amborella trichopoda]|uniref:DUF3700 domain-containing protein n=1 Tax=Amborella trichopoda TaxID=13333 RepID=W1NJ30_AMBTC|nr:stem-specific protein TSJT1 [Amborella trichopoda]ERM95214.1 hypothetical protein AMTR_s00009p00267130 [Amborella trichopoda]|eukprot:XP_006827798.1 stem-specific protein TSJT1 [Amborella trichopoda]